MIVDVDDNDEDDCFGSVEDDDDDGDSSALMPSSKFTNRTVVPRGNNSFNLCEGEYIIQSGNLYVDPAPRTDCKDIMLTPEFRRRNVEESRIRSVVSILYLGLFRI